MILPDVNVVIAALRDEHSQHVVAREALSTGIARRALLVPVTVISGVVRITTRSRVFDPPETSDSAFALVEDLLRTPGARIAADDAAIVARWRSLARDLGLRGNDVSDAYLAAVAIERGATLLSFDRGFARFPGLRWVDPADPRARERL